MKIRLRIATILLALILLCSTIISADPINVYVNDNKLNLVANPEVKVGKTLVPVRAIFEAMGATVEWDGATKTVTGTTADKIIKLTIDNKIALINDKKVELDVPATIINGSTMVPARFVAETLGAVVDWDNNTRSVLVNSKMPYGMYKVLKVVDGDTIELNYNGVNEKVRLIGIDTPESVSSGIEKNTPEGMIASEFTKSKLEGKDVALEFDLEKRDQFDRLLAYVWLEGEIFNKVLIKEGYAKISTYPPNVKYVEDYTKLQVEAKEANKGLWAQVKNTGKYKGSIKSDKYHYAEYKHAGQISETNLIWFDSIEEAVSKGYKPCWNCFGN